MFSIKSFVAFVAGVRKGRERGFWARAGSARGSRAVSRPNSLPSPFPVGGGGGNPLQEANREVPLEGVAFSRLEPDYNGVAFSIDLLEWGRKFWDFWGKYGFKIGRFSVKNQKVDVY